LETKARLTRLLDGYHARKVIVAKKKEEFATKKAAASFLSIVIDYSAQQCMA
jgi:hypothetical protein